MSLQYLDAVARAGSIRGAADDLAITSTALNRRILALEEELGVAIFERLARGVRPTSAGDIVLQHARVQIAEAARLRSRLEDLSGQRSGHVGLACSHQALFTRFLPALVSQYRNDYPGVTFELLDCEPKEAEAALLNGSVDMAIAFEPERMSAIETMATFVQPIYAIFSPDHPLAARTGPVRLANCAPFPLALPTKAFGLRRVLDSAALHARVTFDPMIESNSDVALRQIVQRGEAVGFEITPGRDRESPVVRRRLAREDVPEGLLFVGRLQDRPLSIAAAEFGERLIRLMHRDSASEEK